MRIAQLAIWTVNPARAGMIRLRSPLGPAGQGKPRASGDDPDVLEGDVYVAQ